MKIIISLFAFFQIMIFSLTAQEKIYTLEGIPHCSYVENREADSVRTTGDLISEKPRFNKIIKELSRSLSISDIIDHNTEIRSSQEEEARVFYDMTNGGAYPVIAYDSDYYERLVRKVPNSAEIVHYLVLGHELGHIKEQHSLKGKSEATRTRRQRLELIADWYSGYALGILQKGYSVENIKNILKVVFKGDKETNEYADPSERINHVIAGYFEGYTKNLVLEWQDKDKNFYMWDTISPNSEKTFLVKIKYKEGLYLGEIKYKKSNQFLDTFKSWSRKRKIKRHGFGIFYPGVKADTPNYWEDNKVIGKWHNHYNASEVTDYTEIRACGETISRFFGAWEDMKKSGSKNKIYWSNGDYGIADFNKGEMSGKLVSYFRQPKENAPKVKYNGDVKNGKYDGAGTLYYFEYPNCKKAWYQGKFKEHKRHGHGILYESDHICKDPEKGPLIGIWGDDKFIKFQQGSN